MKKIYSNRYKKKYKFGGSFNHVHRYLEEPFIIERENQTFYIVAPYSAEGEISSRTIREFPGDDLREDNYVSRNLTNIRVTIGDIEQVSDDRGNSLSPENFIITPQEEEQMEDQVIEIYKNSI